MIPYTQHSITTLEVEAVRRALQSGRLIGGPIVKQFEDAVAAKVGAKYAVACNSGTSALHLALSAAMWDCGEGHDLTVALSALTYISQLNMVRLCGAMPHYLDIVPRVYVTSPHNGRFWPNLDSIIVTHYGGATATLSDFLPQGAPVIEDAACAVGSRYADGTMVGGNAQTMCCFSFHAAKMITTGEGGMVTTGSPVWAERLRLLRDQGVERIGWNQNAVKRGFNYRMTEFAAAIGIEQLGRLDEFVAKRRALAQRYITHLHDTKVILPEWDMYKVNWLYFPIQVKYRDFVMDYMADHGVQCAFHYKPTYQHTIENDLYGDAPAETEAAAASLMSLPIFPDMTHAQQDEVIAKLKEATNVSEEDIRAACDETG